MTTLLDHPPFAAAFARLETVTLNPRRHLASDARAHSEAVVAAAQALAAQNHCSAEEQLLLHNLGLAHDIGKLSGSARPEHSLTALAELGVPEPALLSLVKWHELLGSLDYELGGHLERVSYYRASGDPSALAPRPPRTRERRWVSAQELGELERINPELEPILARALSNAGAA